MATPGTIRKALLDALRSLQRVMNSVEWVMGLDDQPKDVRAEAAMLALDIQSLKLSLENEELVELKDALIANEIELKEGQQELAVALKNVEQVSKVLESARAFLTSIERVLPA